jgi:hypothetical protein
MSTRFAKVPEDAATALLPRRPLLLRVYIAHRLASDFSTGRSKRAAADVARELGSKPRDISLAERELSELGLVRLEKLDNGRREVAFEGEEASKAEAPKFEAKAAKKPPVRSARVPDEPMSEARERYAARIAEINAMPEGPERHAAFRAALERLIEEEQRESAD